MYPKTTFIRLLSVFATTLGLMACQTAPLKIQQNVKQKPHAHTLPKMVTQPYIVPTVKSKDGVQDVSWVLTSIQNKPAQFFNQSPNLLLQSANQRLNGSTGCNAISGRFQIDLNQHSIKFYANAGHQYCDHALAQEAELMDALARVASFQVQQRSLVLYDAQRQILLIAKNPK